MKKYFILIMLCFFFLAGCGQETIEDNNNHVNSIEETIMKEEIEQQKDTPLVDNFIPATVVRVIDGDTLIVKLENGVEERVRLLLVDTPETVHPNKPEQPFGREASNFAKEMMPEGSQVHIELDVGERDKYGRLLAYIWIDNKMLNEMLLQKGLARVAYVYAPNTKYVDQFYEIQKEAQQKGIGIWSIENYATEQGYQEVEVEQNEQKQQNCTNPMIKGNHSSSGELIYHVPGGRFYEQTKAEEMFCTEEEAIAAGYRKSKR